MLSSNNVIIVGAGPAGSLLGLLLAKANISVTVLEKDDMPTDETRAVFYQPVSLYEFKRAGILDDVMAAASQPRSVGWRDLEGKRLFGLSATGMVVLTLNKLVMIIQEHISKERDARILWKHTVVDMGQDKQKAWVEVETPQGRKHMEASYVIGCDGGKSIVRRCLFGDRSMAGFTWDRQLVAADVSRVSLPFVVFQIDLANFYDDDIQVYYDFSALPDVDDSNIFMHPENAWLAFRPSKEESYWRFIYMEEDGLSDEEIVSRHPAKFKSILPGHPKPDEYKVIRISPYKIHQRIVDSMYQGRGILASDAAHLCCP